MAKFADLTVFTFISLISPTYISVCGVFKVIMIILFSIVVRFDAIFYSFHPQLSSSMLKRRNFMDIPTGFAFVVDFAGLQ
jgi:hypothetical protein